MARMTRPTFALLALATAAFAGLNLATPAVRLDEASVSQVDLRTNGVLAHVCDGGFGGAIRIDLRRLSDSEQIRIAVDPRVRTPGAVVLQQLPPGRYVATKLLLADRDPVAFPSDTFEVVAGRVTSLGKVKVRPELDLLGRMKRLVVKTDSVDIGARLKAAKFFGSDTLPVAAIAIDWGIEPAKIEAGKRLGM